ncbi:MAG TPA: hypothetical protein VFX58_13695 [Chitinophagaceae bacterium]|nr:hypothetical protein [Chitinophagaceae bacterium]
MVPSIRENFNTHFTPAKYQDFLRELNRPHPGAIEFRVAETAIFIPKEFKQKLLDACESIIDVITDPAFKELTRDAIPRGLKVPGENDHTQFIAFDFGICINKDGHYEPQLIEMQGFPSLFAYEVLIDDVFRNHFEVPPGYSAYLGGHTRESYLRLLKELILGGHEPEHVILLEVFPHQQKTRIDFYCTRDFTGIEPVCITELVKEGKKLFYKKEGKKVEIKRIYNRVIFDDLLQQPKEVQEKGNLFFEDLDVEWAPHPAWFYRISKYTLPLIRHPYVPETFFLHELKQLPGDLENFVLKPLFSFAGQGVLIDVRMEDIDQVKDPENWILQRKVQYADVIQTPDIPAKAEIRLFYFWKDGEARPQPVQNLARLSKGKMIGVRYNKDKEWVGGSYCLFEE